jgi:hypothetical protein
VRTLLTGNFPMPDIAFLLGGSAFFILSVLYTTACDAL